MLSSKEGAPRLKCVELFAALPDNVMMRIDAQCSWRKVQPGESILTQSDLSDDVFFLIEGEARACIFSQDGHVVTLCDLSAGQVFGEYAALDRHPRSASIESRTTCLYASLPGAAFRALVNEETSVAVALLYQCVGKIRTLSARVYEFSTLSAGDRIRAELLRLTLAGRTKNGGAGLVTLFPTHADLASRTSTHREAVTRELNRLAQAGIVARKGRGLVVTDVERLAEIVQNARGD